VSGFCAPCSADFERVVDACPACGLPGPAHACPAASPGWRLDAVRAPFVYAAPLAVYVQRLKFSRQHRLGRALGLLLARELGGNGTDGDLLPGSGTGDDPLDERALRCDLLVPVPLHPRRLRERTFNQADLIAQPVARALKLAQRFGGIRREIYTPAQTGLARAGRLVNPESAFRVRCRLDGARIAIVDDVVTTCATVNALAGALREAGAVRVEAWGVARTVGPATEAAQAPANM
jgi:ComF family protein